MTEIKSCKYTARARSYEFPHSGVNTTSLGNEFEKIEAALAIVFFPQHAHKCVYVCLCKYEERGKLPHSYQCMYDEKWKLLHDLKIQYHFCKDIP